MYCAIAIAMASICLVYIVKQYKKPPAGDHRSIVISASFPDILFALAVLIISTLFWQLGANATLPAHDEIFSALNSAGIHPFQSVSYYMLPNNHVLFNLLNGLLFHAAGDKVFTGRIISLIAYCSVNVVVFYWLKQLLQNRWFAFLICITVALQCPVWGFSFQARGYELYLLAGWGMFISLFSWLLSARNKWLQLNVACCCVGYFCMPSFLYLHAAQLVFMLLYCLLYKAKEPFFWRSQLAVTGITYLLYLPLLCFSGLAALANNDYVAPMAGFKHKGLVDFVRWALPDVRSYIEHIFSNIRIGNFSFDLILFLLPLALIFRRKQKVSFLFGLFYLSMWVVFFAIVVIMKRLPFERNLIGHYSITLAGVVLVAAWVAGLQSYNVLRRVSGAGAFVTMLVLISVHFFHTNDAFMKITLYEHDVNTAYKYINNGLDYVPHGSTVACSDESFFPRYIFMKNGCTVNTCATGTEAYYIKSGFEHLPQNLVSGYDSVRTANDYVIYKRK